jgi:hypothetical protein
MSFYPVYRLYCLLNVKKFKNDYISICYLFYHTDPNFEAFISRNVLRNIKIIVPKFLFGKAYLINRRLQSGIHSLHSAALWNRINWRNKSCI